MDNIQSSSIITQVKLCQVIKKNKTLLYFQDTFYDMDKVKDIFTKVIKDFVDHEMKSER